MENKIKIENSTNEQKVKGSFNFLPAMGASRKAAFCQAGCLFVAACALFALARHYSGDFARGRDGGVTGARGAALLHSGSVEAIALMQQGGGAGDGGGAKPPAQSGGDAIANESADGTGELLFWYEDETYGDFFEEACRKYYEKTGIRVVAERHAGLDYLGDIYDATMEGEEFPDAYLLSGENLEEAVLYGLAAENAFERDGAVEERAWEAASVDGSIMGYPLSFNACVFVYQSDYFADPPASLQSIIDYSNENEPPEDVEYLLEWDVDDAFFDFPFVANSVSFQRDADGRLAASYDEELYGEDMAYFEQILASFSLDAERVSRESVISDFREGRTLCAILDTDALCELGGRPYSIMEMPDLSGELPSAACATTDLLVVNDFSERGAAAADFSRFATIDMAGSLYGASGHYSVIPSDDPDWVEDVSRAAYADAVLVPDSKDAREFWIGLEETIRSYFEE